MGCTCINSKKGELLTKTGDYGFDPESIKELSKENQ